MKRCRSEVPNATNEKRSKMKTEIYTIKNPSVSESAMKQSDSGSEISVSSARRISVSPTQPSDVTEPSTKSHAASNSPRQSLDDLIKVNASFLHSIIQPI